MPEQPGSANRAVAVLSTMMRIAELWRYRRHNSNPCKNAKRFLTAEEMTRLNGVRLRNEAGLLGLRIHDLPHSWASAAAMNGVDMATVAKPLRHALVEAAETVGSIVAEAMASARKT